MPGSSAGLSPGSMMSRVFSPQTEISSRQSRPSRNRAKFYRLRKNPDDPSQHNQYDSPPPELSNGRLDTPMSPALYSSPDLQTCLHECRVTAEDELFVVTLSPKRDLELLDLAALLNEPSEVTDFESLDHAINMLFLAGEHSYPITQDVFRAARSAGFDGLVYPSYFSMLRYGVKPFSNDIRNVPPHDSPVQGVRGGRNIRQLRDLRPTGSGRLGRCLLHQQGCSEHRLLLGPFRTCCRGARIGMLRLAR